MHFTPNQWFAVDDAPTFASRIKYNRRKIMKLIQSPLFHATIIHLILILVAAFKMTKAPDGAAILSLVILGAGILMSLAILLLDWGIRSMPIHFYAKWGFQLFVVLIIIFFEHHLLLSFLNYKP